MPQTWLIVGASRGIGLEFVRQLLASGNTVIATSRAPVALIGGQEESSGLGSLSNGPNGDNLTILECNVSNEGSIKGFAEEVRKMGNPGAVLEKGVIDVVVLNAGVLDYPNRISELSASLFSPLIIILILYRSFQKFQYHLNTNAIGPLITASSLLALSTPSQTQIATSGSSKGVNIKTLVFISSDSGSAARFRAHEDGFGAYSVSKAALNQGLRHLAAEICRKAKSEGKKATTVLAIHPGEVSTDMASNVNLDWEVEGVISPKESIECMLKVISEKGSGGIDEGGLTSRTLETREKDEGEATFWDWLGREYPW